MTFSILGHCERTGMIGASIASSSICVGSHCPWLRPGVGAVAVQYMADPVVAFEILNQLESGVGPAEAVTRVMSGKPSASYRQVAAIDSSGATAHFTGQRIEEIKSTAEGENCVASGNVLGSPSVPKAMVNSFGANGDKHLAERLMISLRAGLDAGGEKDPVHSAALLVAHEQPWPLVNLRIDWTERCPVKSLSALWSRYEPETESYVSWAVDPHEDAGS